jgi:hypothetical protein
MGLGKPPPCRKIAREVLRERRLNPRKIRSPSSQRDDRQSKTSMEVIEIDEVEPGDGDPVEQDGVDVRKVRRAVDQIENGVGRVGAIDACTSFEHGFHVCRCGNHDGDQRGPAISARERSIVDGDDPGMGLRQRSPQE